MEIDCRREEARHPGSLCTPLPSRPLCFLNSPPDILGPRSAGPKTSSSGEQTPEGVLGSLFLLATARSYSGPGVVGRIRTRGRGRVQPYPRLCAAHVPSRSDESDRAHEPLLDRSKPFYDISVSKRCALLGPFSCALRACSDARDHNTTIFSSPKGEGFRPSPEETLRAIDDQISELDQNEHPGMKTDSTRAFIKALGINLLLTEELRALSLNNKGPRLESAA